MVLSGPQVIAKPLDRAVFLGEGALICFGVVATVMPATGDVVPWVVRSGGLTVSEFQSGVCGWQRRFCPCVLSVRAGLAAWLSWVAGAARGFRGVAF